MRTANAWLSLACLLGCTLIAGCSNTPPLAEVRGRVTINGKPIKNVRVDFHPDPDKGTRGIGSSGTTDADGNFTLTYGEGSKPGAIVGHHRVILTDLDVYGNVLVLRGDYRTEDPRGPKETPIRTRFSDLYSTLSKTPFTVEVKAGMEPVAFDIKKK